MAYLIYGKRTCLVIGAAIVNGFLLLKKTQRMN